MSYTLGQAAKATGKSKPTIQRAIKSGKMSAIKNEDGSYLIDPAELHRVFQAVTPDSNDTGDMKQSEPPELQEKNDLLRELLRQVESERDDLRRRLDIEAEERHKSAEEIRRLTLMLTHQPAKKPEAAPDPAKQEAAKRPKKLGLWGIFRKS
jgi:excisionase family DNA binding protein